MSTVFTVDTLDSIVMWDVTWTDTFISVLVIDKIFCTSNTLAQVIIPDTRSIAGDTFIILNIRLIFRTDTVLAIPHEVTCADVNTLQLVLIPMGAIFTVDTLDSIIVW